jgi:hypothetical protein
MWGDAKKVEWREEAALAPAASEAAHATAQ